MRIKIFFFFLKQKISIKIPVIRRSKDWQKEIILEETYMFLLWPKMGEQYCGERERCAQRSVKEKIDILVEESLDKQINTNYYNFFFN